WERVLGEGVISIPLNDTPNGSGPLTEFRSPANFDEYFGQRIRGYLCPPETGDYMFFTVSDDHSALFLSGNDEPAHKQRIAFLNGAVAIGSWTALPTQQSAPIRLVAGQRYYIEALHKGSNGPDHLAVGWRLPSSPIDALPVVIPGAVLSPFLPTLTPTCLATGSILHEQWNGVGGNAVSDIPLDTVPSSSRQLTSFEAPTNVSDNYGARVRGYLCPPQSGGYTFWLASDDDGELFLSDDGDPANKRRIAFIDDGWATPRQWDKYPSQQSAVVQLVAGRRYYVEALHKDSLGGDNLAVGWRVPLSPAGAAPVVIPGSVLSPFVAPAARRSGEPTGEGPRLAAYPNPFTGQTTVSFTTDRTEPASLELYDLRGMRIRELYSGKTTAGQPVRVTIEGNNLAEGLYLLRLRTTSRSVGQRLVLRR
ncbi:MAG: T9SS type A sorting domain-containing protein, partial [Bacteroidetes bacterium]|nr:T9SS type A sorting domain-containing protein [Fibrella sp.]